MGLSGVPRPISPTACDVDPKVSVGRMDSKAASPRFAIIQLNLSVRGESGEMGVLPKWVGVGKGSSQPPVAATKDGRVKILNSATKSIGDTPRFEWKTTRTNSPTTAASAYSRPSPCAEWKTSHRFLLDSNDIRSVMRDVKANTAVAKCGDNDYCEPTLNSCDCRAA